MMHQHLRRRSPSSSWNLSAPVQRRSERPPVPAAAGYDVARVPAHPDEPLTTTSAAPPAPLPDRLRTSIESMSGMDLSDVRVHARSAAPARLDALAFTRGRDIHLGPGQEAHLPHEAWHVVQQTAGRVPIDSRAAVPVNDDPALEREAEAMGARARTGVVGEPRRGRSRTDRRSASDSAGAPVQCYKIDPDQKRPGAFLPPAKTASKQEKDEFRERMATEMNQLRDTMRDKDEGKIALDKDDKTDVPASLLRQSYPTEPSPLKPGAFDRKKRAAVEVHLKKNPPPVPTVGISNRPGFGYDSSIFEKGGKGFSSHVPASLPPGFRPLDQKTSEDVAAAEAKRVQDARDPRAAAKHLETVSGLFIPGGQDREKEESVEKTTRGEYEQALVGEACRRGMPMLGVCGGSRSLARGFGGVEQELPKEAQKVHNQKGTAKPAHPITLEDPSSFLGSSAPAVGGGKRAPEISAVNSTHVKVMAEERGTGMLEQRDFQGVRPRLAVTARGPEKYPEGFETAHGAPVVGVTSHPEAIYGSHTSRKEMPRDAIAWSDNIFKGFTQSMQSYASKQMAHRELLARAAEKARKQEELERKTTTKEEKKLPGNDNNQ